SILSSVRGVCRGGAGHRGRRLMRLRRHIPFFGKVQHFDLGRLLRLLRFALPERHRCYSVVPRADSEGVSVSVLSSNVPASAPSSTLSAPSTVTVGRITMNIDSRLTLRE